MSLRLPLAQALVALQGGELTMERSATGLV